MSIKKVESIDDFLRRGGKITKLDSVTSNNVQNYAKKTSIEPISLMSLDEASFYFAEIDERKIKKNKKTSSVNLDALPKSLRDKFVTKLLSKEENLE